MLRSVSFGDDSLPALRSDSEKIRELITKMRMKKDCRIR